MCGISVIINKENHPVPLSVVKAMNDKIVHRGPDDEGEYIGPNFALGHRRLSILDLSKAGHQPMPYNHLTITYNGEVYNYVELRDELTAKGYTFHSTSDTEVILAAYQEWGVESFKRFNGMWAFAIYDSKTNEIVMCRDHFGIKPLFYTIAGNYFVAGSEIKQFTTFGNFNNTLNKKIALEYLVNGKLNCNEETFFQSVKELRGGFYLRYNLTSHQFEITQWYRLSDTKTNHGISYPDAREQLRHLLAESLRIRMRSDVPVGSCLSGGLDSSAIVITLFEKMLFGDGFRTITSCYENLAYDERKFSNEVNQYTGFPSVKVFPDLNDLLSENHLDKIVYHQDQPILSASHYSEFNVFKKAREEGLIVMLDGQGSDEYFGGYGEFFQYSLFELFKRVQLKKWWNFVSEKGTYSGKGSKTELKNFLNFLFIYGVKNKVKEITKKNDQALIWLNRDLYHSYPHSHYFPEYKNFYDLSVDEIVSTSVPYQLHSEDRNSMMFSVESRLPFLDPRLVEFGLSLPTSYKMNGPVTKAILRDAITALPQSIKERRDKMGFVAPDDLWFIHNAVALREELEEAVKELPWLLTPSTLFMYDERVIRQKKYSPLFFRILCFYKWYKIFNPSVS